MSDTKLVEKARLLTKAMVSGFVGLARRLDVKVHAVDACGLCIATVEPANYQHLPGGASIPNCGGVGHEEDAAKLSALMELAERYCGLFGPQRRQRWGRAAGPAWMYGDRLPVFADWQFDTPAFCFRRLTSESQIRWLAGRSLLSGRTHYVPLAWVQVPFRAERLDEQLFCSTSSGMASGFSLRQALLNGLLELCERDAFMVMWHHRLALPRLCVDIATILGARTARCLSDIGATVHFVNLTNDLQVPVAACVLQRPWRGTTQVTIGLAARPNILQACEKAFFEAASESHRQCHALTVNVLGWQPTADFSNVTDFGLHSLLYNRRPEHQALLSFIWSSPHCVLAEEVVSLPADPATLLRQLLKRIARQCGDVVAVPLTTREIRQMGIHVVKVIAPELVSINADHRYPHLGTSRIWSAAAVLGANVDAQRRELPNRLPHPLA